MSMAREREGGSHETNEHGLVANRAGTGSRLLLPLKLWQRVRNKHDECSTTSIRLLG
jgi:hypothetical protein